ncbi:hypothetical protein Nepgr_011299 [Nepenthes gracilis]|uniref:YTH domain-containing family protein n=1 Tax=Nepenthes gracilis TaxID=150966 RepID=A0AAD3SE29_NEPGR|nr:hypothetical protein Nepgr_011299 [Nepenthes gracilis]
MHRRTGTTTACVVRKRWKSEKSEREALGSRREKLRLRRSPKKSLNIGLPPRKNFYLPSNHYSLRAHSLASHSPVHINFLFCYNLHVTKLPLNCIIPSSQSLGPLSYPSLFRQAAGTICRVVLLIQEHIADMSTDTAKDNASVVDSSVTQKQDMWNLDDPEGSSYRATEDVDPSTAEEPRFGESLIESSCAVKKTKKFSTRYFIIKSLNHHNIQLSIEKGIWATQVMNEPILEEAFDNSDRVILVFSVNMSGFFQGYAQMMSSVSCRRDNVWSQGTGGNNPWGRSFEIKWLRLNSLPFHKTLHLKNPLNDYKPVKISRDCQELSPEIGEALCELIDRETDEDEKVKRIDFHVRWPGMEPACSLRDEGYNGCPVNMTWARSPMLYPHSIYQHHAEASAQSKNPLHSGNIADAQGDPEMSQFDGWGISSEITPLCSTISEDEFLEMSYEEYLEAHNRSSKRICYPEAGLSPRKQDTLSKEREADLRAPSDQDRPRKRTHSRSHK